MKIQYPFLSRLFFGLFLPGYRVTVVNELTPRELVEMGVESVLLDVDCTLKRYDSELPEPWVEPWLQTLRDAKIPVCLLSNGKGRRIGEFAKKYDLSFVAMAFKPFPFGIRKAIRQQGWNRKTTAMVGDQIFADIVAGNLAGVKTVLVTPIHPEMEPIFTRIKRPFEKLIIKLIPTRTPTPSCEKNR